MAVSPYHTPVLLNESLEYLVTDPSGVYVDATLGGGGHTEALLLRLSPAGRVVAFDQDDEAIAEAKKRLARFEGRIDLRRANFGDVAAELASIGSAKIAGILLDLGVSSHQLDDASRGFSFRGDERLDMRMDRRSGRSAYDVVNATDEQELARILWEYGEERRSRQIARSIVRQRPVETTTQLARIVESLTPGPTATKSLARVFQAIRIEVNQELEQLRRCLVDAPELLRPGGRLVVIAYHSLEDRIVKEFIRDAAADRIPSGSKYLPDEPRTPTLRPLTKKPVVAGPDEEKSNPRARSAKLRAAERL
ncbi:MAG: 16S rRNA (cytosine(1402)-N(4))-methyltransferase RsmH [Bacteroidetes bacterium]|nr:16S rRNA (cytosine(1402)-N(4))-methyltransferase RsmH [Bacteroidota bacterium]